MPNLKKAITVRIDPDLLDQVRHEAAQVNRSVTNFIETALRQMLGSLPPAPRARKHAASRGLGGRNG